MLKQLMIVAVGLASLNAFSADVQCANITKRISIPVSADAIKLAKHLNVKTCNGKRFEAVLESTNTKAVYREATAEESKAYYAQDAKGFSF